MCFNVVLIFCWFYFVFYLCCLFFAVFFEVFVGFRGPMEDNRFKKHKKIWQNDSKTKETKEMFGCSRLFSTFCRFFVVFCWLSIFVVGFSVFSVGFSWPNEGKLV